MQGIIQLIELEYEVDVISKSSEYSNNTNTSFLYTSKSW